MLKIFVLLPVFFKAHGKNLFRFFDFLVIQPLSLTLFCNGFAVSLILKTMENDIFVATLGFRIIHQSQITHVLEI